ncbi:S1 RNA-binding domain-containing protein [Nonlabens ponticola]|nr:DNA-binding protein [Nonlabens ponticola]
MNLKQGDKVHLTIQNETPLGYNVIIENEHEGLLYHDEVFEAIEEGMEGIGFIKNIRPDGKIDISMRPQGFLKVIDADVNTILQRLKDSPSGFLMVTDKSSPDIIRSEFAMSKKAFKKAIGHLYRERIIEIQKDRIVLANTVT